MNRRSFLKLLLAAPIAAAIKRLPLPPEISAKPVTWADSANATPLADILAIRVDALARYGENYGKCIVPVSRTFFKMLKDAGMVNVDHGIEFVSFQIPDEHLPRFLEKS